MGSTANIVGQRGEKMCREWSRAGIFIPRLFFALLKTHGLKGLIQFSFDFVYQIVGDVIYQNCSSLITFMMERYIINLNWEDW